MTKKFMIVLVSLLCLCELGEAMPSRYDLRELGRITPVKNQGIPGPCWAFASLGAMESSWLTQNPGSKIPDLSELQLAFYCYRDPDQTRNFSSRKKSGTLALEGSPFPATAFLSRLSGPAAEHSMKYTTSLNTQQKDSLAKLEPESYRRTMRLREAYYLSGHEALDDQLRKELIIKHGAIVVSIYSDIKRYHTKGRYYTYFNNTHGQETNHDVLLAGWDDDFQASRFSPKPSRNGAWLVKNSWGKMRGNNGGYFWMPYEQYSRGGTAFIAEAADPKMRCYYHDALGWCSTRSYSWGANIFRIEGVREVLKEAGFYTPSNKTDYELMIYVFGQDFPKSPAEGEPVITTRGSIDLAGYHTVNLPEDISMKKGDYFSVVLKLSRGIMPVETKLPNYSENAAVHERESYFSRDGINWTDGINLESNTCIKAFTLVKAR